MKKNVGNIDKIIRVVIAIVAATLFFTDTITGVWGYVVLAVGGIMLTTAFINFCALYAPFGITTCKRPN